jgi:hypothetical protein
MPRAVAYLTVVRGCARAQRAGTGARDRRSSRPAPRTGSGSCGPGQRYEPVRRGQGRRGRCRRRLFEEGPGGAATHTALLQTGTRFRKADGNCRAHTQSYTRCVHRSLTSVASAAPASRNGVKDAVAGPELPSSPSTQNETWRHTAPHADQGRANAADYKPWAC